jgi:uncharacterized membrane protein YphA (DoxX/SURF4 family)
MDPFAHEAWFTDRRPGYSWDFLTATESLVAIALALVIAVAWRALGRRIRAPELPFLAPLGRLAPWIPRLLGIHAGVSLLSQAATGTYLAPGLALPEGSFGTVLAVLEAVIGIWLIAGYRIRPAAWLLAISGPLGMFGYGVIPILERVDLLGIALFLGILPPDDSRPGGTVRADPARLATALLSLRLLVGGALVVLAFTEKLARPELAEAFLERYPAFNILQAVGLEVGDPLFIRIAGGVELLFGLLIISGALPQVAVIAAGIPFNATLFFLGASELIGHLPVYGAMLVLIVYGSVPSTARLVPWLPGREDPERLVGGDRARELQPQTARG